MFARIAFSLLLATSALAQSQTNPFAAKVTPSNPKSAYMSKLMSSARKLDGGDGDGDGGDNGDGNDAAEVDADLTGYSLKFVKCQFVKAYSQDLADEGASSVLATQRFVIFRLCPSSSCGSCNRNYGEYAIDMADYLDYTVEYRQDEQEQMCDTCQETCYYNGDDGNANNGDDGNAAADDGGRRLRFLASSVDCSTCMSDCSKYENMEANYYIDATAYINCQQIREDNGYGALYGGPMCASKGSKIKIGVFTDEDCMYLDSSKSVEDYLADENGNGYKLSHALLKTVYDTSECISCLADKEDYYDNYEADSNKDVCANLYATSGKCEQTHGFSGGVTSYYQADNQEENEDLVCEFISSLKSGTYSQEGEIVIGGSRAYSSGGSTTTGGQKFALTFFIIGTVGLAVYAAMLHSQLMKGGSADLSAQGGAMA
jgi:hypothetical protein